MEKERLEAVLRTELSPEDLKNIRIYYLKFYNEPERYVGTDMIKMVLMDIGKSEDPNWDSRNVVAEEPVTFNRVDVDPSYMPWYTAYEPFMNTHSDMRERLIFSIRLAYTCIVGKYYGVNLKTLDIDLMLSLAAKIAEEGCYDNVPEPLFIEAKKAWLSIVKDYDKLGLSNKSEIAQDAVCELVRVMQGGATNVQIMARMVLAYESYCKFIDMTFRCSRSLSLNTAIISEYVHNELSGGCSEVDDMVDAMHKEFGGDVPYGATSKSMQDVCQQVFAKYIALANVGHRDKLLSGKCSSIEEACNISITEAAELAKQMQAEKIAYIEDISTALNQMKIHIDLIRSWSDWDKAPWMEKTKFGYCRLIHGDIDYNVCWNSAMRRLTMWGLFAEWVYGMNDAVRYHIIHDTTSVWKDSLDICESLYEDLVNVGNEWLAKAKHRNSTGVSSLLQMAAGG